MKRDDARASLPRRFIEVPIENAHSPSAHSPRPDKPIMHYALNSAFSGDFAAHSRPSPVRTTSPEKSTMTPLPPLNATQAPVGRPHAPREAQSAKPSLPVIQADPQRKHLWGGLTLRVRLNQQSSHYQ